MRLSITTSKLIEERDRELHNLEQQSTALAAALKAKDADLSDLRRSLQGKEEDFKAETDYLQQQLDDALRSLDLLQSKETQSRAQQMDTSQRLEQLEKALKLKDQDIHKLSEMLESANASLEAEREKLGLQLQEEQERFDAQLELERGKLQEVLEANRRSAYSLQDAEKRFKEETNSLQLLLASKDGQLEEGEIRVKQLEAERAETREKSKNSERNGKSTKTD